MVKIRVDYDDLTKELMISVNNPKFNIDNFFDTTTLRFFLDEATADSLLSYIGSQLQDSERKREADKLEAKADMEYEKQREEGRV